MAFDRLLFVNKLLRYCDQLGVTFEELSRSTGISLSRLNILKDHKADPTGDEVLILADFFKCDYSFFISNERLTAFEQTERLFRKHGNELSKEDRWAIQEFLFLCECEQFLMEALKKPKKMPFSFRAQGNFFKRHGQEAALALRRHLDYADIADPSSLNIFEDFARMGIHIFRRKIKGTISGLCILHPVAGPCILINYSEDPFRQRFSAAHEIAHAIFDLEKEDFVISFSSWDRRDLTEIRANAFASNFLIPPNLIKSIPVQKWEEENVVEWAKRLMVNVEPFVISLKENGAIGEAEYERFKNVRMGRDIKGDPEIYDALSPKSRERITQLLQRGLSRFYANLCFDAYQEGIISIGRLAEMLLINEAETLEIAVLYGRALEHSA